MGEFDMTLEELKAKVFDMPKEDRDKILVCVDELKRWVVEREGAGVFALVLVAAGMGEALDGIVGAKLAGKGE